MHSRTRRSVAVLVDTATGWGRRMIRGIRDYARKHGPWLFWVEARGQETPLRLPPGWHGDGVIARVSNDALARHLHASRLPVVNTSAIKLTDVKFPRVCNNVQRSAELAFQHFRDRGFEHFAHCGPYPLSWVEEHRLAFQKAVRDHGGECSAFHSRRSRSQQSWSAYMQRLGTWLTRLPKPVGVFCWATESGQDVLRACSVMSMDVPGEVAVLGGDDDELLCTTVWPPLSGIIMPAEQIGSEAARVLDILMGGRKRVPNPVLIDPVGISTRQSTDTLAIQDSDVAAAIRFIRSHSGEPIQVEDILREVAISRRALERRFERILGRTPNEEIRRVRLSNALELLIRTELPIPDVAEKCGFGSPQYFARLFAHEYGMTPLKYRHSVQAR